MMGNHTSAFSAITSRTGAPDVSKSPIGHLAASDLAESRSIFSKLSTHIMSHDFYIGGAGRGMIPFV